LTELKVNTAKHELQIAMHTSKPDSMTWCLEGTRLNFLRRGGGVGRQLLRAWRSRGRRSGRRCGGHSESVNGPGDAPARDHAFRIRGGGKSGRDWKFRRNGGVPSRNARGDRGAATGALVTHVPTCFSIFKDLLVARVNRRSPSSHQKILGAKNRKTEKHGVLRARCVRWVDENGKKWSKIGADLISTEP
jgi:hypothetical protein